MSTVSQTFSRARSQAGAWLVQMDWMRGLRAAVALCLPLMLGDVLGIANLGWAGLGGYEAILADTGGPYRSRLRSLLTLSIGGGVGVFLGSLVGGSLYWALPVTVLWCFAWSYVAVLGQPFTSTGVLIQVLYICGVGAPATHPGDAIQLGLLLFAGGIWASLLSLILWPLDAYRPARASLAECYAELGSFLSSVLELAQRPDQRASLWHRLAQHHQYRVRRAVEHGWETVAHVRSEHLSASSQTHQLVVLLETADLLIGRTVALAEYLEEQGRHGETGVGCVERGFSSLEELRDAERSVSDLLVRRGVSAGAAADLGHQLQRLPHTLASCLEEKDATGQFLLAQVAHIAGLLETAVEGAVLLRLGTAKISPGRELSAGHFGYVAERIGQLRQGWDLGLLMANLSRNSLTLRHALRAALVCGADVGIILLLHINHGYWLLMTSIIVLQPHVSGTLRRGVERISGTIAGGVVAAVLAMALHSQMITAAVLFPFALLSLAVLPVSYAAFAFFLTPTFVLAWMPFAGDWQLAIVRVGNTFAGAVLSVLAMLFLFPSYERQRAPQFLRASLAADRRYLGELAAAWRNGSRASRVLASARRRTGLAHNASEESLERLLAESWGRRPITQFATTFVTYLRRFAQGVTTLTALEGDWEWKRSRSVQARLSLLDRQLQWLEEKIDPVQPKEDPWPVEVDVSPAGSEHPGERQFERLERQANVLHRQLLFLQEHGWLSGPQG